MEKKRSLFLPDSYLVRRDGIVVNSPTFKWSSNNLEFPDREITYAASKLTADTPKEYEANKLFACRAGARLYELGFSPLIPGANLHFIHLFTTINWQDYMAICVPQMRLAHSVTFLRNWNFSEGAKKEHEEAIRLDKLIYHEVLKDNFNVKKPLDCSCLIDSIQPLLTKLRHQFDLQSQRIQF